MHEQSIGGWLDELASDAPAPGGGAGAAMSAAMGASLVCMVCNLTVGRPRYQQHEAVMKETLERATVLQRQSLDLAAEDAAAFDSVMVAYKLPKDTPEEIQARQAAIQTALRDAAQVPLRAAATAAQIIELAGRILDGSNPNVIADVAAAAESARAALQVARVNVDANLAMITDPSLRAETTAALGEHLSAVDRADNVVRAVRERITA